MFKIKTLNAISDVIHEELSAEQYVISPEEPVPEGILVRSAVMHDAPLNPELLGIARAGAGVNNIPLDKCTKQGSKNMGRSLRGQTLGLLGCGRIGKRTAEIEVALGMRCIGYSPSARAPGNPQRRR